MGNLLPRLENVILGTAEGATLGFVLGCVTNLESSSMLGTGENDAMNGAMIGTAVGVLATIRGLEAEAEDAIGEATTLPHA